MADRNWDRLDQARRTMLHRLRQTAAEFAELLESCREEALEEARQEIERRFLAPLGV